MIYEWRCECGSLVAVQRSMKDRNIPPTPGEADHFKDNALCLSADFTRVLSTARIVVNENEDQYWA